MYGQIRNPFQWLSPASGLNSGSSGEGLISLASALLKVFTVVAGLNFLINLILAGYQYLSAGGEPKNIARAQEKIWQSLIGLMIVASSIIISMIISRFLFGDATVIINPRLYTP